MLRTAAPAQAAAVLERAGTTVAADGGTLTLSGLAAEKVVVLLGENAVRFSEVSAHRASLEQAYLDLTRDAVEYRAAAPSEAGTAGGSGLSGSGVSPEGRVSPRASTEGPR
jgi:ABC-2 type transport system ATP-binding protein